LVAGVTTYAYLTRPLVAAWGVDWLRRGGGEVRFRAPVFAGDAVTCATTAIDDGSDPERVRVDAICAERGESPRVTFSAVRDAGSPPAQRPGEQLESRCYVLDGHYGHDYGARAGDDLELYERERLVHPAVWPAIANNVFATDLVRGAWIHTRSIVRHHDAVPAGASVDVHAVVVDRFERHGQRAVVDVVIELDGRPVATLEHEAIVDLGTTVGS
jgi:acyl dehydratase